MPRSLAYVIAVSLACLAAAAADKLQIKDLPPSVQKTVQEQTKNAQIKNISKETEDGKTQYEVESMVNGKTRDFNVGVDGALLVVEEETTLEAIPAAAKAAIEKKTAGGKITHVENVIQGGVTTYEAAYTKGGKKLEFAVRADGSAVK